MRRICPSSIFPDIAAALAAPISPAILEASLCAFSSALIHQLQSRSLLRIDCHIIAILIADVLVMVDSGVTETCRELVDAVQKPPGHAGNCSILTIILGLRLRE
jgi:hypothetical protein